MYVEDELGQLFPAGSSHGAALAHKIVERMRYEIERRLEDFEELLIQADSVQYTVSQGYRFSTLVLSHDS